MASFKDLEGANLNKNKVSQTIDLEASLNVDLSTRPDLVIEMGQALLDYQIKRVKDGKDNEGNKLEPDYSESYRDSDIFEQYSKTRRVNMQLTGQMLDSMNLLSTNGGQIELGFSEGQSPKAYGHLTGFEGHPFLAGKGFQRDFFGIREEDLDKALSDFMPEIDQLREAQQTDNDLLNLFEEVSGLAQSAATATSVAATTIAGQEIVDELFDDLLGGFDIGQG